MFAQFVVVTLGENLRRGFLLAGLARSVLVMSHFDPLVTRVSLGFLGRPVLLRHPFLVIPIGVDHLGLEVLGELFIVDDAVDAAVLREDLLQLVDPVREDALFLQTT